MLVLPNAFRLVAREVIIDAIADEIYAATPEDSNIDTLALGEMIFERLYGPEPDPAPLRSGASQRAMREWLERFRAENPGALPKPRISVRAATQHTA